MDNPNRRKSRELINRDVCTWNLISQSYPKIELDLIKQIWPNHQKKKMRYDLIAEHFAINPLASKHFCEESGKTSKLTATMISEAETYIQQALDYKQELDQLSSTAIIEKYLTARKIGNQHRSEKQAANEPFLFFNLPSALADFVFWLGLEVWSIDEAAALSMGKEPNIVNQNTMGGPLYSSPVRLEYNNRFDWITNAVAAEKLPARLYPRQFIEWAVKRDWELPDILMTFVQIPSHSDLLAKIEMLEAKLAIQSKDKSSGKLDTDMDLLPTRSRKTFQKIILGMAIARYSHRTGANSYAVNKIATDLNDLDLDLKIGVDTIRDILFAAAESLDVQWTNSETTFHRNKVK